MALRYLWRSCSVGEDDLVTVYWFPEEPDWRTGYVRQKLGTDVSQEYVDPTATPDEIASWAPAATAYVDQVAAAAAELRLVELQVWRWRRRPVVRRWAQAKYDKAKVSYLDRVRAAASAYQPVRDVIEQRLAEQEAVRLEAVRQALEAQARRQEEGRARFQAWERRQAVADRQLSGGLTPRQMASRGDNPTSWSPEVQAAVGDVASWWAGVRASVRNDQARAEAVREVVEAITATAAALEEAGRPGISAVKKEPHEKLSGWWVDFTWSGLPDVARLRTPPDAPVSHLPAGDWDYDLYLPDQMLFTPSLGTYQLATVTSQDIANGLARRYSWWARDVERFAEDLFPAWITYRERYGMYYRHVHTPITNHADPAVYVPYVQSVAQRAVAAFHALVPGQT
jgi:hypothetical protein